VCAVDVADVSDALEHLGCRAEVLTIDPMKLDDVLSSIVLIGERTRCERSAEALLEALRSRLASVADAVAGEPRPRVAMLEWVDPLYSSGHWVPDLVTAAGAVSVLGASGERSRRIAADDVRTSMPDIIVVAPCGYALDESAAQAEGLVQRDVLPRDVQVWAVDANAAFVRPGPRVVDGVETVAAIAHPRVVAPRPSLARRVT
jgi:iron complex transport system substrate-binding protein